MKFCQGNYRDIQKYFQGSYIKLPEAGETLHWIDRVYEDHIKGKLYQKNEKGEVEEEPFIYYLHPLSEASPEVEYIMPRKSYFNHEGRAMFLSRIPARQYHRGITAENTQIQALNATAFVGISINASRLTAYVGKQAFMPFKQHAGSYAVSSRMAVNELGLLYLDTTKIGRVHYEERLIIVSNEMFIPEVERVLRNHGQTFTVQLAKPNSRAKKKPVATGKGYVPPKESENV